MMPPFVKEKLDEWEISLVPHHQHLLGLYLEEVAKENKKVRLTAASSLGELWRRHILDSLASVPYLRQQVNSLPHPWMADVGSGAGFLGISLKIVWPESRMVFFESNHKKFQFLSRIITQLKLKDTLVFWERVPLREERKNIFDIVLERALAPLENAAKLCLPLCRHPGGIWIAYQSDLLALKTSSTLENIKKYGGSKPETISYRLPEENKDRYLVMIKRNAIS